MTALDRPRPPARSTARPSAPRQPPPRATGLRRWWRRRPVRRALVLTHRWSALVIGLLLVVETTAGSVLLYEPEIDRVLHRSLYTATESASPLSAQAALTAVQEAHPAFRATWVSPEDGIWFVGNSDYERVWAVDPGSGRINGSFERQRGPVGFLVNLHDCALTCAGYPGTVSWLSTPVPSFGTAALADATVGTAVLVLLAALMLVLAVTGAVTWWPGRRKLHLRTRVRRGQGRFARDVDLHNAIGIVAVPFVLLWGLTGAAFELPVVEDAWLTITGGDPLPADEYSFTAHRAPAGTPQISLGAATAAALAVAPGTPSQITVPTKDAPYYEVDVVTGWRSYAHHALYSGDVYVYVDAHDATHVKAASDTTGAPLANTLYEKVIEPSHFGWNVNGWWRLVWLAMGLTPLALMATGVSTWLARRSAARSRARARAARTARSAGAPA